MSFQKAALAGLITMGGIAMSTSGALAWGCTALGSGNAYGYSSNYPTHAGAWNRALRECKRRSRSGACVIRSCDRRR